MEQSRDELNSPELGTPGEAVPSRSDITQWLAVCREGDTAALERLLPLVTLAPGKYSLEVLATDTLSNKTVSKTADFTVKAPLETKSAANAAPGR